jgi:glycosyltransferase involved in cell wall biosynthesis
LIVVLDGPDKATNESLQQVKDSRLRIVELPEKVGAAEARNVGVAAARGEWIAFLDDDDEWLPEKLELQVGVASSSDYRYPIIFCKLIARTPRGDYIWPRRLPGQSEHISEYLFARKSLFLGEGLIQTSMLLTKKELLLRYPFRKGLRRYQESDWLLRVIGIDGVSIKFIIEPLVICYWEEERKSISNSDDWHYLFSWIKSSKYLITSRAYAALMLVQVSAMAARQGDRKAIGPTYREAVRYGKPMFIDFILFVGMWLIPQNIRRWLRSILGRGRHRR